MTHKVRGLFKRMTQMEALEAAWRKVRRGRRYKPSILEFEDRLEENLITLQEALRWKTYVTGPYNRFEVFEPKRREIGALPVKDRVVQHALVAELQAIYHPRFLACSFACQPGKGTHAGADATQAMLRAARREGLVYALKADISSYFASVSHDALKRLMRRHVDDADALWLIDAIIDSAADPGASLPRGIPIGTLTSQLFANVYLHELDLFVKHDLREPRYARYMDDFVVIGADKAHLHHVREECAAFLHDQLGLSLNRKTQVFPVGGPGGRALDFLGYRMTATRRRLRRDSVTRMRRKLKRMAAQYHNGRLAMTRIEAVISAWMGHARHGDSEAIRAQLFDEFVLVPARRARALQAKGRLDE
jgi:hypothetical protein